ncbi:MAG: hypothetical protein JNJ57_04940 [Saprospiraceae bacterium]|nr:hypothetical protein [Saprospiraceae bacterium]
MRKQLSAMLCICFTFLFNQAFAQKDWRWDTHGVGFSAPSNMRVTTNNANEFAAESSDLFLSIYAEQDGEVTEETLKEALIAAATEMEYDNISAADALDIHDFKGYFVEGTKDGVGAFILTLLDSRSATNLVIAIVYTTDEARKKAIDIGDSFYAFDK